MSTPSCKECRHWVRDNWMVLDEPRHGVCSLASEGEYYRDNAISEVIAWAEYDGGYTGNLITRDDFGCVLFDRKD